MLKKNNLLLLVLTLFSGTYGFAQDPNPCHKSDEGMAVVTFSSDTSPNKIQIRTCESVFENNKVELKPVGALSAIQLKNFLQTLQPGNSLFKCFGTLGNADSKNGVVANLDKFIESQRSLNMAYGAGYKYFNPLLMIESDLHLPSSNYKTDGTTHGSIKSDVIKANQDISRIKCAQKITDQYNDSYTNSDLIYIPPYKILQEANKPDEQK